MAAFLQKTLRQSSGPAAGNQLEPPFLSNPGVLGTTSHRGRRAQGMQAGHRARERAPGSSREGRNEFTGHQSDWTASGHVAEGSTEEPETKRMHTLPGRLGSGGWSEAVESQRLLPLERAGVWVRDTGKEGLAASCGVCRTTMRCSWAYPGTRANSLGWRRGGLEHRDRQRGRINTNAWHSCS